MNASVVQSAACVQWHGLAGSNNTRSPPALLRQCTGPILPLGPCPLLANGTNPPPGWLRPAMPQYQLGDCVKLGRCAASLRCCRDSIAARYAARSNGTHNNITLLRALLRQRVCHTVPRPDDLVVHLRLGDVIERSESSAFDMLQFGADPKHHRNYRTGIKSVSELVLDVATAWTAGARRVVLVGGNHDPLYAGARGAKSFMYTRCLVLALRQASFETSLLTDMSADDAFCFMAAARRFVQGVGGYSRLLAKLVSEAGGQLIGRTF